VPCADIFLGGVQVRETEGVAGFNCLLLSLTTILPEEIGAARRRLLTMV
jgi:hypothetical protein